MYFVWYTDNSAENNGEGSGIYFDDTTGDDDTMY